MSVLGDVGGLLSGGANLLGAFDSALGKNETIGVNGTGTSDTLNKRIGVEKLNANSSSYEQLQVDSVAINKIIADMLSSEEGLAAIFGGENATGLFNSTASEQEANDLFANIAGEIAKLTARKTSGTSTNQSNSVNMTEQSNTDTSNTSYQKNKSEGILDKLF